MTRRLLAAAILVIVFAVAALATVTNAAQVTITPTPTSTAVFAQMTITPGPVAPAIIGGDEATPGDYPWMAAILRSSAANEKDGWYCGGAPIRPGWVVTAGHCADDTAYRPLPPSAIDVLIGRHQLSSSDGERIDVAEVILHPNYNGPTYDYDIALLRLSRDSSYTPIDLVPASDTVLTAPGVVSTIVGWGDTRENGIGSYSDVLRQVQVPIITNDVCNASSSYGGDVTSRMLCAGFAEGGKDACQGDSGGPLMVPKPGGGWLQAGITSWGIGCAEPDYYGVYTRISVLADWVSAQIDDATSTATPTPSGTSSPTPTATTTAVTPNPTPTETPVFQRKLIGGLRTSNVRDSAFSVSWTTEAARDGALYVATGPAELASSPMIFTSPATGQAHLVTATGLAPRTTYYFYIRSGEDVDDNRGSYHRVTTGPTLTLPNTDNIRGFVVDSDGAPIDGCTVYAEIEDSDPFGAEGISALLAARSDADGFWTLDLGNARTKKLDAYFLYSATGDKLNLEVQCAPDLGAGLSVGTGNDAPAPAITAISLHAGRPLNTGWNLVALPVQTVGRYDAQRLCAQMKQDIASGAPVEIVTWADGQWSGYICGVDANNFDLQTDAAYFVRHNGPGLLDLSGVPPTPVSDFSTGVGWNGINGAAWNAATAAALCASVVSPQVAVEVNRWFAAGWDGHICAEGFNNFSVIQGDGYFIKTETSAAAADLDANPPMASRLPEDVDPVRDVMVSNLSDTSVTLSWWTDSAADGWVEISQDGRLIALRSDTRGEDAVDKLHYVQVTGLAPEMTYQFTLFSNYVDGGHAGDTGSFTTLPTPANVPQSRSAYGRIVHAPDGGLPTGALAQMRLSNAQNQSLPLTSLVDDNGYWYVNLGNGRTHSGDTYLFMGNDQVEIVISESTSPDTSITLEVIDTFPAPDIEVSTHLFFLPVTNR